MNYFQEVFPPSLLPGPSSLYSSHMDSKPLILVSNDDGIDSPGLHAAVEALLPIADIVIAAPSRQQTAMGRALQHNPEAVFERRLLDINGTEVEGWCLESSPAVAVRHALQCLCIDRKPDMVISGINFGENVGTNVTASGTVGAALQAAVWDYKSLAVSLETPQEFHYEHGEVNWSGAIEVLRKAVIRFLGREWPEDVHVLKVDIPDDADGNTPWKAAFQSREPGWWGSVPDPRPESSTGSTVGKQGPRPGNELIPGDDMHVLLKERKVVVTPLSVNLTSRTPLSEVEKLF